METKILVDFQICISVPLSHSVLLACLKKYRSGNDFIKWAEMLFKYQESCIINEGNTTKYFKLRESAHKGEAYLFIEIAFILIKVNKRVKGIKNFKNTYFSSAYNGNTAFFLISIKKIIKIFLTFSKYSGLKLNHKKCRISGTGVLQSVKVTVCGTKCTDLCNDNIKVTGMHSLYNKEK